ncbi:hypothetical protein N4G69_14680 [Streptomyces mirabilis]|uniref:hypothetical protein n=1 Tax=Streptomyces mirabilis TaxID=68239 RepID=UPI0021C1DF4F|nr:hypothetical protein [Streptomyces mirabilis]MCT9106865.1 hypothetical protein [Streptomyces mirabilis]
MPSPRSPEGADGLPYVAPPAPRLVDSPVFVLSSVRSGSTLLRVQPAKAAEATVELPCRLAELARVWGYPTV